MASIRIKKAQVRLATQRFFEVINGVVSVTQGTYIVQTTGISRR